MRKEQKAQLVQVRRAQLASAQLQASDLGRKVEKELAQLSQSDKLAAVVLLERALEVVAEAERQLALVS